MIWVLSTKVYSGFTVVRNCCYDFCNNEVFRALTFHLSHGATNTERCCGSQAVRNSRELVVLEGCLSSTLMRQNIGRYSMPRTLHRNKTEQKSILFPIPLLLQNKMKPHSPISWSSPELVYSTSSNFFMFVLGFYCCCYYFLHMGVVVEILCWSVPPFRILFLPMWTTFLNCSVFV